MSKASLRLDMRDRLDTALHAQSADTQPIPVCRQGGDTQPIPVYVEPKPVRIMADPPEPPKPVKPKPKQRKPSKIPVQVMIWVICILLAILLYQIPIIGHP